MVRMTYVVSVLIGIAAATSLAGAADVPQDIKGGKDHPLIRRYEGAVLAEYGYKKFDEYVLPSLPVVNNSCSKGKTIEGEVTHLIYVMPKDRSIVEVVRNYELEFKGKGYDAIFSAADEQESHACGRMEAYGGVPSADGKNRFTIYRKTMPEGESHIVFFAAPSFGQYVGPEGKFSIKDQVVVQFDVIVAKPMETNKLVGFVGAQDMADQISSNGRVSLYGLYFDTNKAELRPDSEPTLQEMATLLKGRPQLKLLVVGHTDNIGSYEENGILSQRRAHAVINALASKHGIAKARLTPVGDSFSAPIASNKTEEGRAKNRRVELVER